VGVTARATSSGPDAGHYAAYFNPDGTIGLARRNSWSYSYLGSAPRPTAGPHVLALRVSGANPVTLSVALDGTEVIHTTDSSPQALTVAGLAGIFDFNGKGWPLDDFTVSTPVSTPTPRVVAGDDFVSLGKLGANWSVWGGAFTVWSKAARATAGNSYATLGKAVEGYVRVSAIVSPGKSDAGVLARATTVGGARSQYTSWLDANGSLHIARLNQGRTTLLADAQSNLRGAHKLTLEVQGDSAVHLSVYLDDNPVIDLVDNSPEALTGPGAPGIFSSKGTGAAFQQFRATQP